MAQYDATIDAPVAYPPEEYADTLGEVLAKSGLHQLRIAETEKYAHVTFFFNGGVEEPNKNEERILIPSPKVATYDLQPEMSAEEVTQSLLAAIDEDLAVHPGHSVESTLFFEKEHNIYMKHPSAYIWKLYVQKKQ